MKVVNVPIDTVIPYANNPRLNEQGINKLAASIKEFGFRQPIVVDKENVIIVGHTRLKAAYKLGLKEVPVNIAEDLSESQVKAYRIADNRTAEESDWDLDKLRIEVQALEDDFPELDISLLGFNADELDNLRIDPEALDSEPNEADDELPEEVEPRCKLGEIWQLGEHRLMCGSSIEKSNVDLLLNGEKIDLVYTDPPYGVNIVKKKGDRLSVGSGGIVKSNNYKKIIGDDSIESAKAAYEIAGDICKNLIFWGANYYANTLPNLRGWLVWDKQNTGDFGDGELAITTYDKPIKIFKHQWNGLIKESERNEKRVHPTQKPIALAQWCFDNYASDAKTVLDLFGGSGSTLIACEKTKRKCLIMELSPEYCDVIIKRWEDFTGKEAVLINGSGT